MKRLADQTLYEILEVPQDAAPSAIESAYEHVRSLYAPGSLATYTLMTAEEATLLTHRIEEAKRTLLDAETRARYDASLASGAGHAPLGAAGSNGAATPALGAPPPIIPALETPVARPAELLQAAAAALPAPPGPIRLDREIATAPAAATPVPAAPVAAAPPEIPMPEGSLWTGEALRRVREARGLTVKQIADRTRVTRHHVENIEAERFSALPAPVYLRGILLTIARELRLDGQKVSRAYLERAGAAGSGDGGAKSR